MRLYREKFQQSEYRELLRENEYAANMSITKPIFGVAIAYCLFALLMGLKVFQTVGVLQAGILAVCALLLIVDAAHNYRLKGRRQGLKYANILLLMLSIFICNILVGYKAWLLFAVPIILTCRYYNKLFTINTGIVSAIMAFASAYTNTYLTEIVKVMDLNTVGYREQITMTFAGTLANGVFANEIDRVYVLQSSLRLCAFPNIITIALVVISCISIIANEQKMCMTIEENNRKEKDYVKKLEEQHHILQEKNDTLAEYNQILGEAGYGVWHITLEDGKKPRMKANDAMKRILGVDENIALSEEELYEYWYSRVDEGAIESVTESVNEMLGGKKSENTYKWHHDTLGERYVRCGGFLMERMNGVEVICGYHSDVTEIVAEDEQKRALLREALDTAQAANQTKSVFLNNMSHDIRTPMNAIIGFTALAATHVDDKEAVQEYLRKINGSSQNLLALLNDVLNMSSIESGKVLMEEGEVWLGDLARELAEMTIPGAKAKQIKLNLRNKNLIHEHVITDKNRLNQVLSNILGNAMKFTPAGGTITVTCVEKSSAKEGFGRYEFHIKDTGIGMKKEFVEHIFEAFSRENTMDSKGIRGTGLGMAICKNIVDIMNGTIRVESKEGEGSEFIVELGFKLAENDKEQAIMTAMQDKRLLIVDTDEANGITMAETLRKVGAEADAVTCGAKASDMIAAAIEKHMGYHVVLVDEDALQDMDSFTFINSVRARFVDEKLKLVLMTNEMKEVEEQAREAGVDAFCLKPSFLSLICEAISSTDAEKQKKEIKTDYSGHNILVVEDNALNQEIIVTILEEMGARVEVAEDGLEAVEMVEKAAAGKYELIFMDIQMPRMNGYDATVTIRSMTDSGKAGIPIVAMTANTFDEDREKAFQVGMDGFLAKPLHYNLVAEVLHKFLQ